MMMSNYTQREWDRTVGYGTVPKEYKLSSSEELLIFRVLTCELDRLEFLRTEQMEESEESVIVENWIKKRLEDLDSK